MKRIPRAGRKENVWPQISADQDPRKPQSMYWKIKKLRRRNEGDWKAAFTGNDEVELYYLKEDFREKPTIGKTKNPEKGRGIDEMMQDIQRPMTGDIAQ